MSASIHPGHPGVNLCSAHVGICSGVRGSVASTASIQARFVTGASLSHVFMSTDLPRFRSERTILDRYASYAYRAFCSMDMGVEHSASPWNQPSFWNIHGWTAKVRTVAPLLYGSKNTEVSLTFGPSKKRTRAPLLKRMLWISECSMEYVSPGA